MRMTTADRKAKRERMEAARERIAKSIREARDHVQRGTCPDCGAPLVRNLALTGWFQCAGFASEGFRQRGFEALPSCSFQCFTD